MDDFKERHGFDLAELADAHDKAYGPRDIEYIARLICVGMGLDPDKHAEVFDGLFWQGFKEHAIRALDYMAARGEKVTTRETSVLPPLNDAACHIDDENWQLVHDAAPMTPRTSAQC